VPWDGRERPVIEHVAGASPCPSLVEARLGVWPMALRSGMDMNSDSLTLLDYLREGSLDSCYSYEYTQRRTGSKDVLLALALLCVLRYSPSRHNGGSVKANKLLCVLVDKRLGQGEGRELAALIEHSPLQCMPV